MPNIFDRKVSSLLKNSSIDFGSASELLNVGSGGGLQPTATMSRKFDLGESMGVGNIPMKTSDDFAGFTPDQTVALGAGATALETAGALQNIAANERDEMRQIADQFDFQLENIEYQEWMGETMNQMRRMRGLEQRINNIRRQRVGGGRQVQQFFTDPSTGAPL